MREESGTSDTWLPMDTTGVNLWADALDIINEPVLFFGTDGTVHNANPAALSFYGIDEADLLGMHCYEMVRRFGLRFSDCPYERVLKTGTAESGMIEYNGAWYTHRVEPVSGRDGAVQGMISVVVNGDEPVRLQAASEQLQFLFEADECGDIPILGLEFASLKYALTIRRDGDDDLSFVLEATGFVDESHFSESFDTL